MHYYSSGSLEGTAQPQVSYPNPLSSPLPPDKQTNKQIKINILNKQKKNIFLSSKLKPHPYANIC